MIDSKARQSLVVGSFLLGLAVCFGAFGAHGLKEKLTPQLLETFKTGVTYQYYHAFGLIVLGLLKLNLKELPITIPLISFVGGIILFSFNCYLYALTSMKFFALIVPTGGLLFILGWFYLANQLVRKIK